MPQPLSRPALPALPCWKGCLLAALFACASLACNENGEGLCRKLSFEQKNYVVCTVSPDQAQITLLRNNEEIPASSVIARLLQNPDAPEIIMNAGMYDEKLNPVGLYIENGVPLKKANTRGGDTNFHMLPNGVFYIKGTTAKVTDTTRYLASNPAPDFATQSGPMLVIDGKLHPKITDDGPSRKIRNGVGVTGSGQVMFALSREMVSFGAFARLFRDELKTPNALFLDGQVSALHADKLGDFGGAYPVGPLIVVRHHPKP